MSVAFCVEGRLVGLLRLFTIVSFLAIVPLAHASPPDQTWIAGLYDDADHDDAVAVVTDGTATIAPDVAISASPIPSLSLLAPSIPESVAADLSGTARLRAPPQR